MSAPYCGRRVRVIGTQNAALNGQEGMATTFDTAKGRYHVQLPNKTIALKPVNLEAVSSADAGAGARQTGTGNAGASPWGGFPDFSANSPGAAQARAQVQALLATLTQVLPPGTDPQRALMAGGAYALVMVFLLGVFQGLPVVAWTLYCFVYGLPAYRSGLGGVNGVKAAVGAVAERVATDLSDLSGRAIDSRLSYAVTVGVSLLSCAFIASGFVALLGTPIQPPSAIPDPLATPPRPKSGRSLADAYKQGFDAATNGEVYSNPFEGEPAYEHETLEPNVHASPGYGFGAGAGAGSSGMDIGRIVPVLVVGRMLYTMGKVGQAPWNLQTAMDNFQREPIWKKGLIGLVVLRLFM